jgi:hypothetical protein
MNETLDVIFSASDQEVAQPIYHDASIAQSTIHHVRTSAKCNLDLISVEKVHGGEIDA